MNCINTNCNGDMVKNGSDRVSRQRYICKQCGRTAALNNQHSNELKSQKRLVMHLILAGCQINEIAEGLKINTDLVEEWGLKYLSKFKSLKPNNQLLSINTLLTIFNAIEKGRIAKINVSKFRKDRPAS